MFRLDPKQKIQDVFDLDPRNGSRISTRVVVLGPSPCHFLARSVQLFGTVEKHVQFLWVYPTTSVIQGSAFF